MKCPECNGRGEAIYFVETDRDENTVTIEQRKGVCRTCNGSGETPMTNADRIRAMTDEELAEVILCPKEFWERMDCIEGSNKNCEECCLEWLRQPAEVE